MTPSRHPFSCWEKITCPGKITDIGHDQGHVQDMSRTCETKELNDDKMTGELGENIFGGKIEGRFGFCMKCNNSSHFGLRSCNIMILDEKDKHTLSLIAEDVDTNLFPKQYDDKVYLVVTHRDRSRPTSRCQA